MNYGHFEDLWSVFVQECINIFVMKCNDEFTWIYFIYIPTSSEQTNDSSANNREHHPEPDDVLPTSQDTEEASHVFKEEEEEEKNLTSTPDKAPSVLAPLQLSQLRTKNTDSFDIEEVHDNLGVVRLNIMKSQRPF